MTNQGKKEKMGKKVGRSSPTTIVRGGANPGTSRSRLSARPKTEKARKEASVDFASLSICFLWWRRVISPHPSATPPSQSQPGPPPSPRLIVPPPGAGLNPLKRGYRVGENEAAPRGNRQGCRSG